eukprot:scaffold225093_cov68-Attheya_sp.AAC.4
MICGHLGGYMKVHHISRACETVLKLRKDGRDLCKNCSSDDTVANQAQIDLHELSQHSSMQLATNLLSFGSDKHGIIGPTKASGIDAAIDEMFGGGNLRSGELKDFGIQTFFIKGISNLKQVTASECLDGFDNSDDDNNDVDEAREHISM